MISLQNTNHSKASSIFFNLVKDEVLNRLKKHQPTLQVLFTNSGINLYDYFESYLEDFLISDLETSFKLHKTELEYVFNVNYPKGNKNLTPFKVAINNIFYFSEYDKWNPYSILKTLEINCCPYCNRTYITNLGNDKKKFYRADFDHFLSKSKYPYFRFHFYNLIPSCIICNQRAKGNKETDFDNFIYPYSEGFGDDAKFTYLPNTYNQLKKGYGSKIIINPISSKSKKGKKIKKNIKLFKLNQQYETNCRELHFILEKDNLHPDGYIEVLMKALPQLFKTESEAYEFIFGKSFNEKDFIHQPLAKFTKDICEEIGLIK